MRTVIAASAFVAVASSSAPSFALEQSKHKAISRDACDAAGFPDEFCERVGTEAYNVDAYEWNDLSAHAQVDLDKHQTACQGANAAADRVYWIGQDLRDGVFAKARGASWADGEYLATQLGRALHTIQDDCAHHGLSNPNHAWLSLSDSCGGTKLSPDVQPAAIACAQRETAAITAAFAATVRESGMDLAELDDGVDSGWTHWPARGDVCAFLKSGNAWDGRDSRWDNNVVVPGLRDQLTAGVRGTAIDPDVCHGNPTAIAAVTTLASIDTSRGQSTCLKINLYCLGKGDGADEAPPWEDPAETAADERPAPAAGCAAGGSPAGSAGIMLVAFAMIAMRRRARR